METQNFELGPALRGLGNPLRGTTTGNPKATKTEKFVRDGMQRANRNELLQRGTTTRHNNRVRHMLDKCDLKACCVYVCISLLVLNMFKFMFEIFDFFCEICVFHFWP